MSPRVSARPLLAASLVGATGVVLTVAYRDAVYYAAGHLLAPTLALSGLLLFVPRLWAQLAVRVAWWATALGGTAVALSWSNVSGTASAIAALGAAAGLVVLGRSAALVEDRSPFFAPRAGRASLLLATAFLGVTTLVMAYFGGLYLEASFIDPAAANAQDGLRFLLLAAVSSWTLVKLFHLRAWAWGVATLLPAVVAALCATDVLAVPVGVEAALVGVAVLAPLSQLPLVAGLLRGRLGRPSPRWALFPALFAAGLVVLNLQVLAG